MNRAAACWGGREQWSAVRRRGGRGKRSAGRPGAAKGLPQPPESVVLELVQHSLQEPPCQRLGVSDVDSPIDGSLPLGVSAQSCGQGFTWDARCSCVPFRLEVAIAHSLSLRD